MKCYRSKSINWSVKKSDLKVNYNSIKIKKAYKLQKKIQEEYFDDIEIVAKKNKIKKIIIEESDSEDSTKQKKRKRKISDKDVKENKKTKEDTSNRDEKEKIKSKDNEESESEDDYESNEKVKRPLKIDSKLLKNTSEELNKDYQLGNGFDPKLIDRQ